MAALLLAGGKSRRMGQDKALLPWQGQPLWRVQLQKLSALKPARLLVACREEQALHATAGDLADVEWLFDPPEEDLGPIAAIARALAAAEMPLLVLAVDIPWMTVEFLRNDLLGQANASQGTFYRGPHGYEPLAGLYHPVMLEGLTKSMQRGRLGLQPVIEAAVASGHAIAREIPWNAQSLFQNTNTPAEWNAAAGTAPGAPESP